MQIENFGFFVMRKERACAYALDDDLNVCLMDPFGVPYYPSDDKLEQYRADYLRKVRGDRRIGGDDG